MSENTENKNRVTTIHTQIDAKYNDAILLVVDMQAGFTQSKSTQALIQPINDLVNSGLFKEVVFTQFFNYVGSSFDNILGYKGCVSKEERASVVDIPASCKVYKQQSTYGISQDDVEEIKALGVSKVYMCGVDADACVLAIAFNLFDKGLTPVVISDLVASSSSSMPQLGDIAVTIFGRQFGKKNVVDSVQEFGNYKEAGDLARLSELIAKHPDAAEHLVIKNRLNSKLKNAGASAGKGNGTATIMLSEVKQDKSGEQAFKEVTDVRNLIVTSKATTSKNGAAQRTMDSFK